MENKKIYKAYLLKNSSTIVKYEIRFDNGVYTLIKIDQEYCPEHMEIIRRALLLEEEGYRSIELFKGMLSKKQLQDTFKDEIDTVNNSKKLIFLP